MIKKYVERDARQRKPEQEGQTSEYAARHVSEKYAIEIAVAKTISRLAGLGSEGVRQ